MELNIRYANQSDIKDITKIYNQAILLGGKTADTEKVTESDRLRWFENRDRRYPVIVSEFDGEVVGYGYLSPYRPGRKATEHTAEVSYYIDNNFKKKGIATKLLEFITRMSSELNFEVLIAIVLATNTESINFLKKHKFKEYGVLPGIARIGCEYVDHCYYCRALN